MAVPGFQLGTFITTGAPGAPVLRGALLVNTDTNEVSSVVVHSTTNNPPTSFSTTLEGVEHTLGEGGVAQAFALRGHPPHHRFGAPYITTLSISLPKVWGSEGTATYSVFNDSPRSEKYKGVAVRIQWEPIND